MNFLTSQFLIKSGVQLCGTRVFISAKGQTRNRPISTSGGSSIFSWSPLPASTNCSFILKPTSRHLFNRFIDCHCHYYCSKSERTLIQKVIRKVKRMSSQQTPEQKLALIKDVDIDPQGRFKYILIKVYVDDPANTDASREMFKYVVRGYADCEYHADIYDRLTATLTRLGGLDSECVGGGRILHEKENKKISVFGYSQGYGRADHSKTVEILKTKYPDYNISWNNDGY